MSECLRDVSAIPPVRISFAQVFSLPLPSSVPSTRRTEGSCVGPCIPDINRWALYQYLGVYLLMPKSPKSTLWSRPSGRKSSVFSDKSTFTEVISICFPLSVPESLLSRAPRHRDGLHIDLPEAPGRREDRKECPGPVGWTK